MKVTRTVLVEAIQDELNLEKQKAGDLLETVIETMKKALENGEEVLVSGFGKLFVREKKSRLGRDPQTGDVIILPRRKVVMFKCSKILRARMNNQK